MNQSPHPLNILLVDDNPDNLRLLSNMLRQHGYQNRRVISGQMALEVLKANSFDLIFLDICMPEMDGYEVCRRIKSDPKNAHIPIIFISALNEVIDKVKAFQVGGVDYINKPFQIEELIARLEHQVKILNLQKQLRKVNNQLENKIKERTQQLQKTNDQLKQSQQKLFNKSIQDYLTNLNNKVYFMGQLRQAFSRSQVAENYSFAVLIFDFFCPELIDEITDFDLKDSLTIAVADRLAKSISNYKVLSRLEANEFAILLEGIQEIKQAEKIAKVIANKLNSHPLYFNGQNFAIVVNYGIALSQQKYPKAEAVFKQARLSAHQAKKQSYLQYKQNFSDYPSQEFSLLTALKIAFKTQQISLLYQPIINLSRGEIKELEVFFTLSSQEQKIITFAQLLTALAIESSLAIEIFNWILQTIETDLKQWREIIIWQENLQHIDENIKIRFPLLKPEKLLENFNKYLNQLIKSAEISRQNIIIEISEAFISKNFLQSYQLSKKISEQAINLSIDHLSTTYLIQEQQTSLPINNLKISAFFLQNILKYPTKTAIFTKVIELAKQLNMTITLSEISTPQQLQLAQQLNCEYGGGELLTKPVISQEISNLITKNPWLELCQASYQNC